MRILTNCRELGIGSGADIAQLQAARELARRGHEIDVVFEQDGELGDAWRSFARSAVQVPPLDVYGVRHGVRTAVHALPAVRAGLRTRPDVVWDGRYVTLPWARAVGTLARRPVVAQTHGFFLPPGRADRVLARAATTYVAVSESVRRDLLARGARDARIRVVHQGIDVAEYPEGGEQERLAARVALGIGADDEVVTYVGRIAPVKGVEVLLAAVRSLNRPVVLLLVGGTDLATLRTLRAAAPAGTRFLGQRRDVVTPLHAADVVVVPSVWDEPFGRTAVEGLATGRPVVASAVGGLPEIFTGDLAALLFPRGDVAALAAQLTRLRDWRRSTPQLGAACAAHVRENLSLAASTERLEAVLLAAAAGARGSAAALRSAP